jgi:hypothetical protein
VVSEKDRPGAQCAASTTAWAAWIRTGVIEPEVWPKQVLKQWRDRRVVNQREVRCSPRQQPRRVSIGLQPLCAAIRWARLRGCVTEVQPEVGVARLRAELVCCMVVEDLGQRGDLCRAQSVRDDQISLGAMQRSVSERRVRREPGTQQQRSSHVQQGQKLWLRRLRTVGSGETQHLEIELELLLGVHCRRP